MEPEAKPTRSESRDSSERDASTLGETVSVSYLAQKFDTTVRDVHTSDPVVKRGYGDDTRFLESPLSGQRLGEAFVLDGCNAVKFEASRKCTSAEEDQDQAFYSVLCQSMSEYPMDHDSSRCTVCILSSFFGPIN